MLPYLKKSFKNLFGKASTEAFPAGEPPKAAPGYRGRIAYDPTLCINCGTCIRVCAPQDIERTIKTMENGDQEITFTFDMTSCTFCRMCADFCPRGAIKLTDDYMIIGTKPEDFLVSGTFIKKAPPPKPKLTPEQIKAKAEAAKAAKAKADAAKAAAAQSAEGKPAEEKAAEPAAPKPAEPVQAPKEAEKPVEAVPEKKEEEKPAENG